MASGDKLYLADKGTLDLVKATVDSIAVNTAKLVTNDTSTYLRDTIYPAIQRIEDTSASSKTSMTVEDTQKLVRHSSNLSSAVNYTHTLSVEGPGEFYYAMGTATSPSTAGTSNTVYLRVYVDGKMIYNAMNTSPAGSAAANIAIVCKDFYIVDSGIRRILGVTYMPMSTEQPMLLSKESIERHSQYNNPVSAENIVSMRPIRFENSLEIRANTPAGQGNVQYCYKLD